MFIVALIGGILFQAQPSYVVGPVDVPVPSCAISVVQGEVSPVVIYCDPSTLPQTP